MTPTTQPQYPAFLEFARDQKSRTELNELAKKFRTLPGIAPAFKGLTGRKFTFVFKSHAARLDFLIEMEKQFKHFKTLTERVGW